MNTDFKILSAVIDELSDMNRYQHLYHKSKHEVPMPSVEILGEIVSTLNKILFPGYFGDSERRPETVKYYIGSYVDSVNKLLSEQIKRGLCFACEDRFPACSDCDIIARNL